jgi:hypothetical protein
MGRPPIQTNIPEQALRWELGRAAEEFQLTRTTLRKYLAGISARPGADGCFSTAQITAAAYGDLHAERERLTREHRRKLALHNAAVRGGLVNRAALTAMFSQVADSMCSRIRASSLTRDEQSDLLRELASIPVSIESIAAEQSRLPRGRQHDGDGEGDPDTDLDEDDISGTGKVPKRPFRRKPGFKAEKAKTA